MRMETETEQIQINEILEHKPIFDKDPLERTSQEIASLQQSLQNISFFRKLSKPENEFGYNLIKESSLVNYPEPGKFIYTTHS